MALVDEALLGRGEIALGSGGENAEHVDGLAGAEEVDLGLLAFLGAAAELQDGLHVDGLDDLLEAEMAGGARRRGWRRGWRCRGGRRWPRRRCGTAPSARRWGRGAVPDRMRRGLG